MEIIAIEKKTLEAVEKAFERFTLRMDELCTGHTKQLSKWLDNEDVCRLLGISKRTLQTYRDKRYTALFTNQSQNVLQGIGHRSVIGASGR